MRPHGLRRLPRPAVFEIVNDKVYITLSNGRVYTSPIVLYPWLQNASVSVLSSLEFQRDRLWWSAVKDGIRVEELLLACTTQEIPEDVSTRFKRRCIILLDSLEATVLRHRLPRVCHAVAFSSWWGDKRT